MNASKTRWCWRKDLAEFRGLTDAERAGFLLLLEWFENFRLRHELPAGREAAKVFWKSEVIREGREREKWQLDQWADAIQWYLNWLSACSETGADHRSLRGTREVGGAFVGCAAGFVEADQAVLWRMGGAICEVRRVGAGGDAGGDGDAVFDVGGGG